MTYTVYRVVFRSTSEDQSFTACHDPTFVVLSDFFFGLEVIGSYALAQRLIYDDLNPALTSAVHEPMMIVGIRRLFPLLLVVWLPLNSVSRTSDKHDAHHT